MHKIVFEIEGGEDVTIFAAGGENVLELARTANIPIDAPCSGSGTCGKCLVKLIEGELGPVSSISEVSGNHRLACQSVITGDVVLYVPDKTGKSGYSYMSNLEVSYNGTEETADGLAVDIGTTTVSAMLVNTETGFIHAKATTGNSQTSYGADVINRIIQQQKQGGINKLQRAITVHTLLPLIDNLCTATDKRRDKITLMTVAANTTMNHLLLGVDANSIRIEPYEPAFLKFEPYDPASIGINLAPGAKMILSPNIGSYVGGDITAGVLAAATPSGKKIWERPEMTLLIDLGTNGEIVFGNEEFLMACACSAGPAFEGGDISCGMRAANGAIEACVINKETQETAFSVVNDFKPAGLCGSGLIDVVAELFRTGLIDGKGKLNEKTGRVRRDEYGNRSFVLVFAENSATGEDIVITETDIDNFIRAKGAIYSGIMSLLAPLGFTPADIDDVLIAGGIGSGINIKNAIRIGMLPDLPEDKYSYIGNSSLCGALEMLLSPQAIERVNEIADNMTYVELSTQPGYMDEFIAACFLPHTNEKLFPSAT